MAAENMEPSKSSERLVLGFGLTFADLYDRAGLERLDAGFLTFLNGADADLHDRLIEVRRDSGAADRKAQAELLLALVPYVEDFMGDLFKIADEVRRLQVRHDELAPLYAVKRSFVQRRATKGKVAADAARIDGPAIAQQLAFLFGEPLTELAFARRVGEWLKSEPEHRAALELAAAYATWATLAPAGQRRHGDGILFKLPQKIDRMNSIPLQPVIKDGVTVLKGSGDRQRHRDGFRLTDGGASFAQALDQASYCIWCHNQGKDSCSQGLRNRKTGFYEHDVFGVELLGCPLEERTPK
jgi:hypothetical protein